VVPIALLQHLLRILFSPPKLRHSAGGSGIPTQRAVTYMMYSLLLKSSADHSPPCPKNNITRTWYYRDRRTVQTK
jgi:hypothetical protein